MRASYTYGSLGYYFDWVDMVLGSVGHFFCECQLAKEKHEHQVSPQVEEGTPGGGWGVLFQDVQATEATLTLEKILDQDPLDLNALGSARTDPHLRDFLEKPLLR